MFGALVGAVLGPQGPTLLTREEQAEADELTGLPKAVIESIKVVESTSTLFTHSKEDDHSHFVPVNFETFVQLFGPVASAGPLLQRLFAAADRDGDGHISAAELVALHVTLVRGGRLRSRFAFAALGGTAEKGVGRAQVKAFVSEMAMTLRELELKAVLDSNIDKVSDTLSDSLGLPKQSDAALSQDALWELLNRFEAYDAILHALHPMALATQLTKQKVKWEEEELLAKAPPVLFGWQGGVITKFLHALELDEKAAEDKKYTIKTNKALVDCASAEGDVFVTYWPAVYGEIQRLSGIPVGTVTSGVTRSLNTRHLLAGLPLGRWMCPRMWVSEAKSGSMFFGTDDGQFLVKDLPDVEFEQLRKMVPKYFAYLQANPESLLCRFTSQHQYSSTNGPQARLIIMENVLKAGVDEKFDLKGCYNRDDAGKAGLQVDGDWKRAIRRLDLSPEDAKALIKQLGLDAEFLSSQNVMDYSLLIGVKHIDAASENHTSSVPTTDEKTAPHQRWHALHSASGKEIYRLAVIDILTPYNLKKMAENAFKAKIYGTEDIVCVPPKAYSERFATFMQTELVQQ